MLMNTALLCLHGWGGSAESFTELRAALADKPVELYTPDLPGFGSEPEPSVPWYVEDYANWVLQYISSNIPQRESRKLMILGHSHGGRIAIKLTTLQRSNLPNVHHIFLCAAAGIRHPRHIKRIIGLMLAKSGKALLSVPGGKTLQPLAKKLLYKLVRVHDYEQASDIMKQTLVHVSAEDLRPQLRNIHIPTDIFWGTEDGMTPYSDARVMEAEIPQAHLHSYPGVRHGVHRDKAKEIAQIIEQYL